VYFNKRTMKNQTERIDTIERYKKRIDILFSIIDRLRGKNSEKDLWYRGYRIHPGYRKKYEFVHDDYDGAPDAGDNRHGEGDTIEHCMKQIDELYQEEN